MSDIVIIGAGPSGLGAAYEIARQGASATVVDRLDQVGGLSRTIPHDGCLFDIGPHRFFTKNEEIHQLFADVVAEDLLRVPRLTRIFFRGKFFNYPLHPANAFFGVGIAEASAILGSYAFQRIMRTLAPLEPRNLEEWGTDQFGSRLFQLFFKSYTEKVWGIPCARIGADWAVQRIKGLSLSRAVWSAFVKSKQNNIKTLVDEFLFPRLGAGQFYEKMASWLRRRGTTIRTGCEVIQLRLEGMRIHGVTVKAAGGCEEVLEGKSFLSSAPLTDVVQRIFPPPPDNVIEACRALRYRNHIGVHIKLSQSPFLDTWIYVHSKDLKMARIANYRNFSKGMANGDDVSPLTVEYFAFPEDEIWNLPDEELVGLASAELAKMKLLDASKVVSAFVVRSEKAYPVIEISSQKRLNTVKEWLNNLDNFLPIGRCGMFKYNNQDHAIATGLLAARKVLGLGEFDPWLVNIDAEYHESGRAR